MPDETKNNIDPKQDKETGTSSDSKAELSSLFSKRRSKKKRQRPSRQKKSTGKATEAKGSFKGDVISLLVKIAVIICAFVAIFMFVFGVYRVSDDWMKQSVHQGDIIMYYRLDKNFNIGDLAVIQYEGKTTCGRVVARGGDTIDIDHNGLKVNGNYVTEPDIVYETLPYVDGFSFPQTVPPNSVFLLGDYRTGAIDSRVYGAVSLDDVDGKVIAQFRRRGF